MTKEEGHTISEVERVEETEKHCGIRLEGIHAVDGSYVNENLCIVRIAFNKNNRVPASSEEHVFVEYFFMLSPLDMHLSVKACSPVFSSVTITVISEVRSIPDGRLSVLGEIVE